MERTKDRRGPFVLSLALCLGLAALAEQVGLAALVGAFVAGMVLASSRDRYDLDRRMLPLFDFLVPFFFVVTAARMDPRQVVAGGPALVAVLASVTIAAKLAGCALGAIGLGVRERIQVGAGMIPRNEVTLVVASQGVAVGILAPRVFSILVATVMLSTVIAPLLLRPALSTVASRGRARDERPPEAMVEEEVSIDDERIERSEDDDRGETRGP
jgi:Kef-type K+ transport system membrane component KefB